MSDIITNVELSPSYRRASEAIKAVTEPIAAVELTTQIKRLTVVINQIRKLNKDPQISKQDFKILLALSVQESKITQDEAAKILKTTQANLSRWMDLNNGTAPTYSRGRKEIIDQLANGLEAKASSLSKKKDTAPIIGKP